MSRGSKLSPPNDPFPLLLPFPCGADYRADLEKCSDSENKEVRQNGIKSTTRRSRKEGSSRGAVIKSTDPAALVKQGSEIHALKLHQFISKAVMATSPSLSPAIFPTERVEVSRQPPLTAQKSPKKHKKKDQSSQIDGDWIMNHTYATSSVLARKAAADLQEAEMRARHLQSLLEQCRKALDVQKRQLQDSKASWAKERQDLVKHYSSMLHELEGEVDAWRRTCTEQTTQLEHLQITLADSTLPSPSVPQDDQNKNIDDSDSRYHDTNQDSLSVARLSKSGNIFPAASLFDVVSPVDAPSVEAQADSKAKEPGEIRSRNMIPEPSVQKWDSLPSPATKSRVSVHSSDLATDASQSELIHEIPSNFDNDDDFSEHHLHSTMDQEHLNVQDFEPLSIVVQPNAIDTLTEPDFRSSPAPIILSPTAGGLSRGRKLPTLSSIPSSNRLMSIPSLDSVDSLVGSLMDEILSPQLDSGADEDAPPVSLVRRWIELDALQLSGREMPRLQVATRTLSKTERQIKAIPTVSVNESPTSSKSSVIPMPYPHHAPSPDRVPASVYISPVFEGTPKNLSSAIQTASASKSVTVSGNSDPVELSASGALPSPTRRIKHLEGERNALEEELLQRYAQLRASQLKHEQEMAAKEAQIQQLLTTRASV